MRHADVMRAVRNMEPAWQKVTERKFALSEYKDSTGRTLPCYSLTKTECLYVATKFNDEARAKLILRWEELETGKSQPRFVQQPTAHPKLSDKIQAAKFLAKFLNLNDASKLQIAKTIADPLGLPTPDYVESKGAHLSAKDLLAKHGAGISSVKFNETLVRLGYLTTVTRKAAGGKDKTFKVITDKGAQYGENMVSPHNYAETQPHWYIDKFQELLAIVTKAISGGEEVSHD